MSLLHNQRSLNNENLYGVIAGNPVTPSAGYGATAIRPLNGIASAASSASAGSRTIITPYQISADRIKPVAGPAHLLQYNAQNPDMRQGRANCAYIRIVEEDIESAIESRNEALNTLRELGPPDLVHLIKQSVKSGGRQVRPRQCQLYSLNNLFYRLESIIMSPELMRRHPLHWLHTLIPLSTPNPTNHKK